MLSEAAGRLLRVTGSSHRAQLQLRRLEVTHVRGDELFADDTFLTGRLLLRVQGTVVIVPCSDVTATLSDLSCRREVSTATLLLRPVEHATPVPTVTLTVLSPVRPGELHALGTLSMPAGTFDEQLRRLAAAARRYCAERGEKMLVEDLTPLSER